MFVFCKENTLHLEYDVSCVTLTTFTKTLKYITGRAVVIKYEFQPVLILIARCVYDMIWCLSSERFGTVISVMFSYPGYCEREVTGPQIQLFIATIASNNNHQGMRDNLARGRG